jgi:hypothetical protein
MDAMLLINSQYLLNIRVEWWIFRWYAKPTVKARFSTTKELQNQYGKENKKS